MSVRYVMHMNVEDDYTVSVIIPVHNESTSILDKAIESILLQTYPITEIIICDDGSIDTTWSSLQKWKTDKRVIVLRNNTSKGAAHARNVAIKATKGDFIALMDADDVSEDRRIEKQVAFLLDNEDIDFVGCKADLFKIEPRDIDEIYRFIPYPQEKDFLMALPFVHASLVFRRNVLDSVNGYREINRVWRSEDYDMLMRLYELGFRGANIPDTLYHIRVNGNALGKRKYRYRFNEAIVKFEGFSRLGLMPKGILYAIKPIFVGLIPYALLHKIKIRYYEKERVKNGF